MAPSKKRPDKWCDGCNTIVSDTTFWRHKKRLAADQPCTDLAPRQRGIDTPDGTRYECSVCKKVFNSRSSRRDHERTHEEGSNYGVADFHCLQCDRHFVHFSNFSKHNLRFHTEFEISKMTRYQMKRLNPFTYNRAVSIRGEAPVSLTDEALNDFVAAYFKWISTYSQHQKCRHSHPIHAYIGAKLGPNFPGGTKEEIVAFIKARLAEVGWYVGINSEMGPKGNNINRRHERYPDNSPLGRGGLEGEIVICAHTWTIGNPEDLRECVQIEGRGFEAGIINYLKTLTSFTAPGEIPINLLNERDECGAFSTLLENAQEEFITDGVTGRNFVCIEDVCDGNCGSVFHLDPDKIKIANIQPKKRPAVPGLNVSGGSTRQSGSTTKIPLNPKPRPVTQEQIQSEVDRIILDLNKRGEKMDEKPAFVYTVILPSRLEFPDTVSARTVVKRIARGESDGPTPYYIGEGRRDGMDSHHQIGSTSIVAKTAHVENRRVILIRTFQCASLAEARKLEARLLIHAFLQVRKKFDSHHFNPLNKQFPWTWLESLSDEEIKEAITFGLKGIPPFVQSGNDLRMADVEFPISLVEALKEKSVEEIHAFEYEEGSDDEDSGSDEEVESDTEDEEENF